MRKQKQQEVAVTLYGINSAPLKALDLVRQEMCIEKG